MSFEKLLRPSSVAVIGASANPSKVGYSVLANLINDGFSGDIYPINPGGGAILGRTCYKSILEVPGDVDLVIIVVKRELVASVIEECRPKNTKAAIVITAGYSEAGEEGRRLQAELAQVARECGITLVGPNCLGIINPWHKLNASFGQKIDIPGHIGLFSQSGALLTAVQDMAASTKLGFSMLASIGNKASLDEVDFLYNLKDDPETRVIAAYLENITNGQEFMRVAERVSKVKPIVILKSGRTSSGAKAASSHTGSLAGADSAYNSAFERCGVIRAESIEELFDISMAFAYQPLPKGDRVGIVTNAGGPGIMMSDAIELRGLKVAALDEATTKKLLAVLPAAGSAHNPVDVLGDAQPDLYAKAVDIMLASDSVDALIVILTPQKVTDDVKTAQCIVDAAKRYRKTVFTCFLGGNIIATGVDILRTNHIPQYSVPERAANSLFEMIKYERYKSHPLRLVERFTINKNPVIKLCKSYFLRGRNEIGEVDSKTIMKAYNFELPPGALVSTAAEAVNFGNQAGYPLAMKISSPDILHKSDVGGVKVGLRTPQEVEDAFDLMMLRIGRRRPDAEIRGVFLEKMVSGGREVILGMKKDPQFGPMLMFGLGGIFVEILKDVTFSLAPVTPEEALSMIENTKSYRLLRGARGQAPVDIGAIVENIQRLSQLVIDFPVIDEIDINPLMVGHEGDGAWVVDARIVIAKERPQS